MNEVPVYPKIFTLGARGTEDVLDGHVHVQEKVDGSFFGFGKNEHGQVVARSRGRVIDLAKPDKMFAPAVDFVTSSVYMQAVEPDTYFYAEYLQRPKHNVLTYGRIPSNHLVLFDAVYQGRLVHDHTWLSAVAALLGIDVVPEFAAVGGMTPARLEKFHERESFLGGERVEGVVIKNYGKLIELYGQFMPLYAKFVRDSFRERHAVEWSVGDHAPRLTVLDYMKGIVSGARSEARWRKATLKAREADSLAGEPKDIGPLIRSIQADFMEEERSTIERDLFAFIEKDLQRQVVSGFPEWYKQQLAASLSGEPAEVAA